MSVATNITLPNDCYPCIVRMALATARLAGLDDTNVRDVLNWVLGRVAEGWDGKNGVQIAAAITDHVHALAGSDIDPYAVLKKESNIRMLKEVPFLQKCIDTADDPFVGAIRVAAAGNIIDFGAKDHADIDLEKELTQIPTIKIGGEGMELLRHSVTHAKLLLYIGDNAGEIVCDKVCINELQRQFPTCKIIFAVRGKPVLNDITMVDAEEVGLTDMVSVISSGSRYPGTILEETNKPFQEIFASADCIIAKGQGNYETLSPGKHKNLFHVFRVKCNFISKQAGVANGSLAVI